jgi:hypothetical protein
VETFPDDTSIFIKRSEQNLRNVVKIIADFTKISGLAANLDKTMDHGMSTRRKLQN